MSFRLNIHCASFTSFVLRVAALAAALAIAPPAHAITQYWDVNGIASGFGGTGTWAATTGGTGFWNDSTGTGPQQDWADGNDAVFNGTAGYTVTQSGNFAPNSLELGVTAGNVTITGGTLTIGSPTSSIVMKTNVGGSARTQVIASAISGTDITVVANAVAANVNSFLTLGANVTGATNTFTGDLIFGGTFAANATGFHQININNPTALPSTATIRMRRTQSQLLFTGAGFSGTGGYTAIFNNPIILNDGGSGTFTQSIGASASAANITLGGVISGNAGLTFQLGNGMGSGKITLTNNSTYTGSTTINTNADAELRLGVHHALPVGTTLSIQRGILDLKGFNQQVGGLASTGTVSGDLTNSGGGLSTFTIDGSVNSSFPWNIGSQSGIGGTTNIALVLAPTNTGRLTLTRSVGNDYAGGTTIGGGKLIAAGNPAGSSTGTGSVAVDSGGTLGGNGGAGDFNTGPITVASGGHIAPGLATGTTIGTLTAFGSLSLASGSRLDMDLGAPAPSGGTSDRVNLPNITALTVSNTAASIGVNLSDPAGGAAGNGTYTLMSFQAGQYSGTDASAFFTSGLPSPNSLNGATITYQLADDSNVNQNGNPIAATRVNMVVSGGSNALVWTGGVDGAWTVGSPGSPFNFTNLGTGNGATFAGNDNVLFDDTGANTAPIAVAAGGVQPNIITINNTTSTYLFTGGDIKGSSLGGGGGLYLAGTGPVTLDNNYTAAGPIVSNKSGAGTAAFNGAITAATSVTVNGGAITLSGANTYAGDNTINGGSLTVSGTSATFGAGDVTVNSGSSPNFGSAAIAAGVADAIANSATLTLLGGGAANTADAGFINLAAGINEQVAALMLGNTLQAPGTYGATGSTATNIFDEYFSGGGIISVVAAGVPGDYNNNGTVDAADYVTWRTNVANAALPNDNGLATQAARFTLWRANFGNSGAGTGLDASAAVPEPATFVLLCSVVLFYAYGQRSRRHR